MSGRSIVRGDSIAIGADIGHELEFTMLFSFPDSRGKGQGVGRADREGEISASIDVSSQHP